MKNFKIAAGLKKGQFYGAVFQDTDVAKWSGGSWIFTGRKKKNEKLEKLADDAIDVIVQAQQKDGYLDTYFIIKEPEQRWRNLCEGHELYSAGHMIEAAIAYYEGTGKRKLLDSMIRLADLIRQNLWTRGGTESWISRTPGDRGGISPTLPGNTG